MVNLPLVNYNNYYSNASCNNTLLFRGSNERQKAPDVDMVKLATKYEQIARKGEFCLRKVSNKTSSLFNGKTVDAVHSLVMNIPKDSPQYPVAIANMGRFWAGENNFEINAKKGSLDEIQKAIKDIASSDEACIFIMNHENQSKDPALMAMFNTMLTKAYIEQGKAASCPKPQIILNEDILLAAEPKMREIFEWAGAIGVDASINSTGDSTTRNSRAFAHLLSDFCKDKANIFIFPEGRNCMKKNIELRDRFQSGVGDLIRTAAKKKQRVKVIPLGFSYKTKLKGLEKETFNSMYVGEPVYVVNDGDRIAVTRANVESDYPRYNYRQFFARPAEIEKDGFEYKIITDAGQPITDNHRQGKVLSNVLAENLRICIKKAKEFMPAKIEAAIEV